MFDAVDFFQSDHLQRRRPRADLRRVDFERTEVLLESRDFAAVVEEQEPLRAVHRRVQISGDGKFR